jgi:Protein of unknown function (DUF3149)
MGQRERVTQGVQWSPVYSKQGVAMKALMDLFSTDYGLFSITGIVFMIYMSYWFYSFFQRKMSESETAGEK